MYKLGALRVVITFIKKVHTCVESRPAHDGTWLGEQGCQTVVDGALHLRVAKLALQYIR